MLLAILGRQPRLGLAELESRLGPDAVQPVGADAALLKTAILPHSLLGGVIKLAKTVKHIPTTHSQQLADHLLKAIPEHVATLPDGKITLGLSVYNLPMGTKQLFALGLEIKKASRATGRSVRLVPNNSPSLNSAQVIHNQLTGTSGAEFILVRDGKNTWLAQTISVQDVEAYAKRDHGRPKRDAFVGMLPPKLAQIMLNLAQVQAGNWVLDPFCGTGVVLQEATLMGCNTYGTDLQERMVRFTRDNLAWLHDAYNLQPETFFEVADATNATWRQPIDAVVCEAYLGQPLSGLPKPEKLASIRQDCNTIITKFLKNVRPQLATGSRFVVAVPAWHTGKAFTHLPLLDDLENLGYNRVRFQHAAWSDLIYHRQDQVVARELLVLTVR